MISRASASFWRRFQSLSPEAQEKAREAFRQFRKDPDNLASARLLERLGMRQEGRFIENAWFKGAWSSECSYALLQREWAPPH